MVKIIAAVALVAVLLKKLNKFLADCRFIFYNEDLERTEEQIVCFMREVMMSEEV